MWFFPARSVRSLPWRPATMSKSASPVPDRCRFISDEQGRPGMTTSTTMLSELAKRLDEAARNATAVDQLAEPIDAAEAYEVQRLSVARRIARGERHMGIKMGRSEEHTSE